MSHRVICGMLILFVISSPQLMILSPYLIVEPNPGSFRENAETRYVGTVSSEVKALKAIIGVYEPGKNYNEVFDGHGTGLRPPTSNEWLEVEGRLSTSDAALNLITANPPPCVDLIASPWFPPIGDQKAQGSCTCWSIGYYMKTFQEAKEHGWNLSKTIWGGYPGEPTTCQNNVMSPSFLYHLINQGQDAGSSPFDAISLIGRIGICSWQNMPYDPGDAHSWPSEAAWREAPYYRGGGSRFLSAGDDYGILELKSLIAGNELASIFVDADEYQGLTENDVWTLDNYVHPSTNHMNTIVGYDDNIEYLEQGQVRHGAFKVVNSWGAGRWENVPDGCLWISYETMKNVVLLYIVYDDLIAYTPKLLTTFEVEHPRRNDVGVTVSMGSPFSHTQKSFYFVGGVYQPYCPNDVVFDITEFINATENFYDEPFFLSVQDTGDDQAALVLSKFKIELLQPMENATSRDTPLTIVNGGFAIAATNFKTSNPTMSVTPTINAFSGNQTPPESTFTVNLTISNINDLWAWSANLTWNPVYLNFSNVWLPIDNVFNEAGALFSVVPENGSVSLVCAAGTRMDVRDWSFNGTGTLCQIEMKILAPPSTLPVDCNLTLAQKYWQTFVVDPTLRFTFFDEGSAYFWYAPPPDIALTRVESTKSLVGKGDPASMRISIKNEAIFDETIRVTLHVNETQVAVLETSILGTESAVLTYTLDTSEYLMGSYSVSAAVDPVSSETDMSDNVLSGSTFHVGVQGDLTADDRTDLRDIGASCIAFESVPGDLRWNPNADFDCSGRIDMRDISQVCSHFGKTIIDNDS